MKHYNHDGIACYPQGFIEEKCKNCARYLENKPEGNYIIRNFRTSGSGEIGVGEDGESYANVWYDCWDGTDWMMWEEFEDGVEAVMYVSSGTSGEEVAVFVAKDEAPAEEVATEE